MGTPSPMVTATVGMYPQPDQQLGLNSSVRGGGGALMYPLAPPGDMTISTQQQGGMPMHHQVAAPMQQQVGTPRGTHPQGGTPMQQQGGMSETPNTSLYMSVGSHVTVGSYGGSHVGSNVGSNVGSMPAGVRLDEIRPSDAASAAHQRQKETAELQKAVMKMKAEDDARKAEKEQRMREGMERLKMQEAQKQNDDALQRKTEFERLQATVAQQEKANAEAARVLMLEAGRLKQVRADNERRMFEEQARKDMMVWEANEAERRRLAEEKQKLLAQQRSVCIDPGDVCIH